jgi:Fic family protein
MAAHGQTPLYLSPYIEAHKPAYYAALKAAQQRLEWPEMIGFMADAIVGTVTEVMRTRTALRQLQPIWRARRRFRAGSAALRTLDLLPHYPVLTIGRLAGLLGVSWPQASQAIGQLVEVGILRERTGYRRNRLFSAPEVLTILNRPFGEEPILPGAEEEEA